MSEEAIPAGMQPVKQRLRAMQGTAQHPLNLYKCAADEIDRLEQEIENLKERIAMLESQEERPDE